MTNTSTKLLETHVIADCTVGSITDLPAIMLKLTHRLIAEISDTSSDAISTFSMPVEQAKEIIGMLQRQIEVIEIPRNQVN
jgi:hypothetical protein